MSTLTESEAAIERLTPAKRVELVRWWQKNVDPDEGLTLCKDVARELDTARREIQRGEAPTWQQVKQAAKTAP